MRRELLIAIAVMASPTSALAEFPKAFRGLWTDSALACMLYKERPSTLSQRHSWIRVTPHEIAGSTTGRFVKIVSRTRVRFQSEGTAFPSELTLHPGGILEEGVVGARATMHYQRCPT